MPSRVAIVTGASRGVGKGIAIELCAAHFTVYITGRSVDEMAYLTGRGTAIPCDHRDDQQVERAFHRGH
jgi:dehydrogenase/reductase SDR family member 1